MNLGKEKLIACLLMLCLSGCAPTGTTKPVSPVSQPSGVWSAIADRVESNKIDDTDEVLKIVRELRSAGDITDAQADAVSGFGWAEKNTRLNADNRSAIAERLRGLK